MINENVWLADIVNVHLADVWLVGILYDAWMNKTL